MTDEEFAESLRDIGRELFGIQYDERGHAKSQADRRPLTPDERHELLEAQQDLRRYAGRRRTEK
jgi:hypothetical protein